MPHLKTEAQAIVAALTQIAGASQVSTRPQELRDAARDTLRPSRATRLPPPVEPLAIVRPRSTSEVSAIVRLAKERALPLVELGGGTGLMGGARTIAPGIVLDLTSMDRILAVDRADRTATVQAGVVLESLDQALAAEGLMLGHDPWTVPVATAGGTISTNSLGYRGARYGSMGDQVLGLEVVLGDGSIVRLRPAARSSTGPRLRHLFIGAEGTLGVITEATLRVFPQPELRRLHALDFPDFDCGFHAVEAMFAIGLVPAMIDYGQGYSGPRDGAKRFTPNGAGRMQLAFEGFVEEVEAAERRALAICLAHGAVALPQTVAQDFWQERHVDPERFRRPRPNDERNGWLPEGMRFDFVHVALPASRVLDYRDRAEALLARREVSVAEWGLWNQPELFSVVVQQRVSSPAEEAEFSAAVDALVELAQDLGGSMEYCHGAGLRLARFMAREHGAALTLLRALKTVIDPLAILNPGKLDLEPPPNDHMDVP